MLRHLQRLLDDVAALVLHEEQVAVGFALADLLHHAEQRDGAVEVAPGVVRAGRGGDGRDGCAQLVDLERGMDCRGAAVGDCLELVGC